MIIRMAALASCSSQEKPQAAAPLAQAARNASEHLNDLSGW
jgi:hypothetical protein